MSEEKVLVKNAANESEVNAADKKEKNIRKQELSDIQHIMSTVQGRRFMNKLISFCRPNSCLLGDSEMRTHFNVGIHNVGNFLWSEILEADEELVYKMMRENKN